MNVWHYTASAKLPAIANSGELRPSNAGAPGELALLWFSAHQQWEPTATKMLQMPDGRARQMTFTEQAREVGCARFGIRADEPRLLPWDSACRAAGTPRALRRAMESSGKKAGGNPAHWFGCLVPIPLRELTLQVWGNGAWLFADTAEVAAAWLEVRGE